MFFQICVSVALILIGFSMASFARYMRKHQS
jgi:hypothetical protein